MDVELSPPVAVPWSLSLGFSAGTAETVPASVATAVAGAGDAGATGAEGVEVDELESSIICADAIRKKICRAGLQHPQSSSPIIFYSGYAFFFFFLSLLDTLSTGSLKGS